ncbi:MAG: hypothetical protein IKE23_10610, partial [Exiguobacterium sp.]|nr:hypothetical protein [Exiguobacterium sp.]
RVDPTSSVATKITTATTGVYMPSTDDLGYKLRVVVSSDANNYTGTATYNFATVTVQNLGGLSFDNNHPIYSAGYAAGNATIVATPSPSGATATYQWYRSNGSGTDTAISGATSSSYQALAGDLGYYLKCVATGTGNYIGSVNHTSAIVQQKFIAPVLSVANSSSDPTGSLVVTFTTSETDETNATLECSTDQSTWTEVETKKESGSYSFTKGSLTANTTYYFRAKLNGSGNYVSSEYSAVVSGVTSTSTVDIDVSGGQVTSPVVYGNTFQIGNVKLENIGNVDATGVIVYFFVATTQQEINSLVQASTPSGYIATATIGDIDRGAIRRAESGTISTSSLSVGDYYVGWRAIANETDSDLTNNYGVAVSQLTITAATGGWAVTSSQTFTYDGNAHSATITGAENATVEYGPLSSGPWSSTPITRTDVGHTDFYVKVSQANYTTTTTLVSVVISAKPLTIVASANSKVYDGTRSATGSLSIASGGVVSGDEVTVSGGVGTFDTKNVGTNKTVTFTIYSLTGAQSGNYSMANNSATATANINAKALSATGIEVEDKIYNRATDALLSDGWEVPGIASGDDCTCTPTATFAQSDASDSPIATTVTFALSGDDAGNYTAPGDVTGTAMIHPKQLTISGTTVANKSYDGTTDATATAGTLFGVEDGDTVSVA